jgi:hypothetical protein
MARFDYRVTVPDGTTTEARGYVHFRLIGGQIVSQDVMTDPDMTPVLAPLMAPPTSR